MAKRSDTEYAQMSEDIERGDYTVSGEVWVNPDHPRNSASQCEYNNSPELQALLNSAMNSPTVRRKRHRRSL